MLDRTKSESPPDTGIVPRATVEVIVAQRDRALAAYGQAYTTLEAAAASQAAAAEAMRTAAPREDNRFAASVSREKMKWIDPIGMIPRADYLATARRLVDTSVWGHIIGITDLERLMDKQAKDELLKQLQTDPPEITADNIQATLEQFCRDAGMIFKRGIANCFTKLDRKFRSHDGWKIGGRVILTRMYDGYGFQNYQRDMESVLADIERTFFVLDGQKVPPNYAGILGQLRESRYTGNGPRQGMVESDFFRVRVFQNGNCHVWFKRDDLLEKVNQLLGEFYGAPIPEEKDPVDDGGLHEAKTSLAKNYGFFPTPDAIAESVVERVPLHHGDAPKLTVLEPSAGTGNLAKQCLAKGAIVDCIEIQPELAQKLRTNRGYRKVICGDFLAVQPGELYDRVVMNPPFDRERDIDHVMHALKFLKPGGHLTAIMSASTEFRETRKSKAFREHMAQMNAYYSDLPAGAFASVGTQTNTLVMKVWKDGRKQSRWGD